MRNTILWIVLVFTLAIPASLILDKEKILKTGTTILLELGRKDPRSIMQGDYMTLVYRIADEIRNKIPDTVKDGSIVIKPDDKGVATLQRAYQEGDPLREGEHILRYRKRGANVRIASEAFFFQEGQARTYGQARYGELKVDRTGNAILVGLRDAQFKELLPVEVSD